MNEHFFIIYLIYGAVFINLGLFSLSQKKETLSQNILVKSIHMMGFFGLLHGISEWLNVLLIADVYPELTHSILIVKQLFKALSFVFLALFGLQLNVNVLFIQIGKILTYLFFSFWFFGFLYWVLSPARVENPFYAIYNTILLRYTLAFLSAMITSRGFYLHRKSQQYTDHHTMQSKLFWLSFVFFIYAIVEGILIKEQFFFPANAINRELFLEVFRIPVQIIKIVIGLLITINLVHIVNTFYLQQQEKINQLISNQAISEERQRMNLEIHDGIMQYLYVIGMKIELLHKNEYDLKKKDLLTIVKDEINQTLSTARQLISRNTIQHIDFNNFHSQINDLIRSFASSTKIQFHCNLDLPEIMTKISTQNSTHIYYIVQETLLNAIKHSKATNIYVSTSLSKKDLLFSISDDGCGFDYEKVSLQSQGLKLMKVRLKELNAQCEMTSNQKGTTVNIIIPREAFNES